MKVNDFPQHLQELIESMNSESEAIRKAKEIEKNTCKIRTYCTLPGAKKPTAVTLEVHKDLSLNEATDAAYKVSVEILIVLESRTDFVSYFMIEAV